MTSPDPRGKKSRPTRFSVNHLSDLLQEREEEEGVDGEEEERVGGEDEGRVGERRVVPNTELLPLD